MSDCEGGDLPMEKKDQKSPQPGSLRPESQMMTFGYRPEWSEGAVKPPVFMTSTFAFQSAEEGKEFFNEVTEKLRLVKGTPIIYVNETIIQGFDKPDTTGQKIIALIDAGLEKESIPTFKEFSDTHTPEDIIAGNEGGGIKLEKRAYL